MEELNLWALSVVVLVDNSVYVTFDGIEERVETPLDFHCDGIGRIKE